MKYFLILLFLVVLLSPITEGISCYKHGACSPKEACVIDSFKSQCSDYQTFCFKNDILLDVAERGCAESYTCNSSIPIPLRYCCNTDYCNHAISSIQTNYSFIFLSTLISYATFFLLTINI